MREPVLQTKYSFKSTMQSCLSDASMSISRQMSVSSCCDERVRCRSLAVAPEGLASGGDGVPKVFPPPPELGARPGGLVPTRFSPVERRRP